MVRRTQCAIVLSKCWAIWPHSTCASGLLDDNFWKKTGWLVVELYDTVDGLITQHKSATANLILRFRRLFQPKRYDFRPCRKSILNSGVKSLPDHPEMSTFKESSVKGLLRICKIVGRIRWSRSLLLKCKKIERSRCIGTLPEAVYTMTFGWITRIKNSGHELTSCCVY